MANESILVVDDEEDILELVQYHLSQEGYQIHSADSGEKALKIVEANRIDLILLDLMLPGINGYNVARQIKSDQRVRHIPIVMLTAKAAEADVVTGLELGAEDYITKPFSPRVLMARIHTVLRRKSGGALVEEKKFIEHNGLTIDMAKHEVVAGDKALDLTYTEFEVLNMLASRPGWVFSRSQIVKGVRGYNYAVTERSVDVQIVGLRRKLGQYSRYIETVRGVGYRFRNSVNRH